MTISFAKCGLITMAIVIVRIVNPVQCIVCGATLVACKDGLDCIYEDMQCNGLEECSDGSDEDTNFCLNYTCPNNSVKCNDGTCTLKKYLCDGENDCPDGSDEASCLKTIYDRRKATNPVPQVNFSSFKFALKIYSKTGNDPTFNEILRLRRRLDGS